jgi:glycosyltransferase involved in cell wall biosynthesis
MPPPEGDIRKADLHCHSDASNRAAEVVLNAISCPECYSAPEEVYAQAKRRGMDFVTITDHDSIAGVQRITHRDDVLIGEELTCWFPEDHCKLHVLIWGITPDDHAKLQSVARSIYDVAAYIEQRQIAHAVAHPIYRQNDKLERWHLERLLLLFKGFECLNGAHSPLHRDAFEARLNRLTANDLRKLSETHGLEPRWPEPWRKSRTAGSDDHGLLNIGRTWTEFPADVRTTADVLQALREGRCAPAGEAGSSAKLAHTFYSVAIRYYTRHIMTPQHKPNLATTILQTIAGERRAPSKREMVTLVLKNKLKKIGKRIISPFSKPQVNPYGTTTLKRLFLDSIKTRAKEHPELLTALNDGLPPLGEHEQMFNLVSQVNRDVLDGITAAIDRCVDEASFTGLFDSIGAILAQQFVLLPYYFTVFHQNKERHLLRQITGQKGHLNRDLVRVGLFTDTLDEVNGVARFIRDMGEQSQRSGRNLMIHTCSADSKFDLPNRHNFRPLLSREMPYYTELRLNLPPVMEILEWADRQQFDAVHVSTPGPMGLCGWLVAKMLHVPLVGTYHTDFPAYVDNLARDHRITNGTVVYMKWLYGQMATVFARSKAYRFNLHDLGLPDEKLASIPPGINTGKFSPSRRDANLWNTLGVREPLRMLYVGRVSVEKNLPMLVEAFKRLCTTRRDVAIVVAGDGPYRAKMTEALASLPAHFLGYQNDAQLGPLYASSDLFVFPSRTDTLGQVVMEAQASGLPVLVSNEGGPKELVEDGVSGMILPSTDPARWCDAIAEILSDEILRHRMASSAAHRGTRYSLERTFEGFWDRHLDIIDAPSTDDGHVHVPLQAFRTSM